MRPLFAILFLASASVATAQDVPKIDVVPSCRAAAAGKLGANQDYGSCLKSEQAAREILASHWNKFPAADRGSCFRLTTPGTPGTYTELLTCLEMKRDARALPDPSGLRKKLGD